MDLSMLEKLILFFVFKTKGYITKTQLVKFLYLADLYAVKWTEKQLTDLDWRYYRYGPWSEKIDPAVDFLCKKNIIRLVKKDDATLIQPVNENLTIKRLDFPKGLELMLRNIQKEWASLTTEKINDLLDFVYQTQPMIEAKTNHTPEEKALLDLSLEHQKLIEQLGV